MKREVELGEWTFFFYCTNLLFKKIFNTVGYNDVLHYNVNVKSGKYREV